MLDGANYYVREKTLTRTLCSRNTRKGTLKAPSAIITAWCLFPLCVLFEYTMCITQGHVYYTCFWQGLHGLRGCCSIGTQAIGCDSKPD